MLLACDTFRTRREKIHATWHGPREHNFFLESSSKQESKIFWSCYSCKGGRGKINQIVCLLLLCFERRMHLRLTGHLFVSRNSAQACCNRQKNTAILPHQNKYLIFFVKYIRQLRSNRPLHGHSVLQAFCCCPRRRLQERLS